MSSPGVQNLARAYLALRAAPAEAEGEEAHKIVSSEISDAIAAHDAGEQVNCGERARHVLNALVTLRAPTSPRAGAAGEVTEAREIRRMLCDLRNTAVAEGRGDAAETLFVAVKRLDELTAATAGGI